MSVLSVSHNAPTDRSALACSSGLSLVKAISIGFKSRLLGRKEEQFAAGGFGRLADAICFGGGWIVHGHNIAAAERRHENLFDIGVIHCRRLTPA